jgi:chemotaxis family two-component system sensor kinase Cph1
LLFNMAMMYDEDIPKSIELYEHSLKIATEIQDTRFIMSNYENLSEIYADLKNYQIAYEYKIKAQNLERELFGTEKTKAIKEVEHQLEENWRGKEIEILKNRNDELNHFVHKAALEIKEPLKLMNSLGNILTKRYSNNLDNKALEYLSFITESSNHLNKTIDNLIKYAIVGIEAQTQKIDLNDCLTNTLKQLESRINSSKVQISSSTLPVIYNDKKLIELLLFHLIDNALKFRKTSNAKIEISTQEDNEELIISIKDNGIGIAPTDQERIFKIFERVHEKNVYQGDGVGLAICQKIMDTLHGSIWIDSKLNHGTNIFLKFRPLSNPIID